MINKKISMNYNLSEQELINYNQTSFSIENNNSNIINNNNELNISGASNDKSQENLVEIEIKNIHMLILQRSLYIMKRRFEKNKKEIEFVYEKYKDKNYRNLRCISTLRLFDLYKDIMETIQINLLPYENFNELITADLMTKFNEEKYNTMLNALVQFTKKNIEKYNKIFYENKMKKKKIKEEQENKNKPKPEEVEVTDKVKIVHKDKRGEIIDDFEKMIENNKKIDIKDMIFSINEDDMSILTNKKLLYNDVIPLIIADFLQNYMKNNINIGIILSNNYINENDDLNENIKALYDKEIIKKYNNLNKIDPKEEKNEKLKNLLFESNNIDNQIRIYNELVVENSNKGLESSYLMEMVRKLKGKKIIIQKKINEINKKKYFLSNNINNINNNEQHFNTLNQNNISSNENSYYQSKLGKSKNNSNNNSKTNIKINSKKLTKNEIRKNNLFDIFSFYSKQHILLGRTPTIDSVLSKEKHMNLSEFAKFCIEFKILVKNNKINEIFKKYTKSATYMSFDEFIESLNKMASLVNEEKKQYIKERINIFQLKLQEMIEKEKKKKNKKPKKKKMKNIQKENNNNEEIKNEEQTNNENKQNTEQIQNQNQNKENNEKKEENKNIENKGEENKKEENNNKNKEEKKDETNENKEINENKSESQEKNGKKDDNNNSQNKSLKKEIKDEKPIILTTKEELEEKISKLQKDYMKLENKSVNQLIEELYIYLEIDDTSVYRQKMVGYTQPFLTRGKDTRNPEKNVKYPIKFNPKNIREMYDLLMKRNEDLKKENEIKKMKEKELEFEKRKRKFNKEIKKLEKDYGEKIKKDNYQQIKRSEEDYLKEKNNKLTWQLIQKCDYQNFLLNDDENKPYRKNIMQSNLEDIFVNKSNQLFEKDDEDFINKVYSNQTRKQNYDSNIYSSKHSRCDNYVRNSHLSIDSNKRYKLGKRY